MKFAKVKSTGFIRRIVVEAVDPSGTTVNIVLFTDKVAPVRRETNGEIRCELRFRQFVLDLGFDVTKFDARDIGGPEDLLDESENVYRLLKGDSERLLAIAQKVD